jgi:sodium/potassium-transporting ATPase subunit alpha
MPAHLNDDPMANDEHRISLDELCSRLKTSAEGLASREAAERLRLHGPNAIDAAKKPPLIVRFGRHLFNLFGILLWVGAILAFVSEKLAPGQGSMYIGIALSAVVVMNAAFTFIQEYQSEKIIESFSRMMPVNIEALRDGARRTINAINLVPGDVIFLGEGDKIPADARLVAENVMKVDHSSLTGESEPQLRCLECTHENIVESRNMVFSGTTVQSGHGVALVFQTGMKTEIGKIAGLARKTGETASPLRRELDHFIRIISTIAMTLGLTFFIVGLFLGGGLMSSMIFAIGIVVANVPEGLLPTVTLCLGMASKRMVKRKALIKKLESVETLGSTTVICTDKTGTITENRMSVGTAFINMEERGVLEEGVEKVPGFPVLLKISALCNNARVDGKKMLHGDPTEIALLKLVRLHGDSAVISADNPRSRELPFDSVKRRMITVNRDLSGRETAYLKGAPEQVLGKCDRLLHNGAVEKLAPERMEEINVHYRRLASRGERVLALAYKEGAFDLEEGFVFTGLIGMMDPPRKDVHAAFAKCRSAGIKVIMITGDSSVTACAIAEMAGLVKRTEASIMTGDELDKTSDDALKEFLKKNGVIFARGTATQKLRIVKALQAMGEVVTVTGDGVNDAPALKHADMGVAMGVSGTEVAKEAADMVLLDDHFATIVNAVEEGRAVFGNIRKFISYILTSNVPEIMPFIAFALLGIPLPLTVVLILAVDLGTDLLPALGLGVETPEDDVMKRPPRPRTERLLTPNLLTMSYGVIGMVQAAAGFFAYFIVLYSGGWTWGEPLGPLDPLYLKATTAFFVSIIICQIANVMNCRTRRESIFRKGIFTNRLVLLGIALELALFWTITHSSPAQKIFGAYPLTHSEMLLPVPFALFLIIAEEARKLALRRGNAFVARYMSW